jgi:hypothetical protein
LKISWKHGWEKLWEFLLPLEKCLGICGGRLNKILKIPNIIYPKLV